jgi:hypothetical protein
LGRGRNMNMHGTSVPGVGMGRKTVACHAQSSN